VIGKLAVVFVCAIALPTVAADGVEPLAPANRTTLLMNKGVAITFTWKATSGAPQYRFQLSRLPDFSDLVADRERAQTSTVIRDLGAGRYYWRCTAHGSAWSPTQEFMLVVVDRPSGGQ
jgi:hypothetical protein